MFRTGSQLPGDGGVYLSIATIPDEFQKGKLCEAAAGNKNFAEGRFLVVWDFMDCSPVQQLDCCLQKFIPQRILVFKVAQDYFMFTQVRLGPSSYTLG